MPMSITEICELFERKGHMAYAGEPVTQRLDGDWRALVDELVQRGVGEHGKHRLGVRRRSWLQREGLPAGQLGTARPFRRY